MRHAAAHHRAYATEVDFSDASVSEVLELRYWALRFFAERERAGAPPCATSGSWRLFLYTERCALPLASRAAAMGLELERNAALSLDARVAAELARVDSVVRQLREIAALAAAIEARFVVLKGGTHVACGGFLDLGDLDLLTSPEAADELQRRLELVGYRRIAGHEENPQRRLARGDDAPIELHVRSSYDVALSEVIDRSVALSSGLYRLSPPDHLAHLLLHSVKEYGRAGSIRELLLLGVASRSCEPAAREQVLRELASHPRGRSMIALHEMARDLEAGVVPRRHFADAAAIRCIIAAEGPRIALPARFHSRAVATAIALLEGGIGWPAAMRTVLVDLDARSPTLALDWLLRATPRFGCVVRAVGRAASFSLSAPSAIRLVRRAKRLANGASALPA